MDGLQGAVLDVKLKYLDRWNEQRRKYAQRYQELLAGCGDIQFLETRDENEHIYHLFVVKTSKRDALQQHLKSKGIDTGIHYPIPIHLLEAMQSHGGKEGLPAVAPRGAKVGSFPIAEKLAQEILSLPMYPELTEKQIDEVCVTIEKFFE